MAPKCGSKWISSWRLHVPPGGNNTMVVHGCDGQSYDVIALISALLDRMDRAAVVPIPKSRPKMESKP